MSKYTKVKNTSAVHIPCSIFVIRVWLNKQIALKEVKNNYY